MQNYKYIFLHGKIKTAPNTVHIAGRGLVVRQLRILVSLLPRDCIT